VPQKIIRLVISTLEDRRLPIYLAFVAGLIALPSLRHGLIMDDLIQRAWLLGPTQVDGVVLDTRWIPSDSGNLGWSLLNLFSWFGRTVHIETLIESGTVPWWTCDTLLLSFWRPVASFFHWLDYALWPNMQTLMHAQNILWHVVAVFVITLLYRQLIKRGWIAGLAALFFTLDDGFYTCKAWLANRHAVIALVFGVLSLMAHHRWRSGKSWALGIVSSLLLLCALLSSEQGIGIFAYLLAYAVFLDRSRLRSAFAALLPSLAVIVGWRLIYGVLGHGVSCTGMYIDPLRDPVRFAMGVLENAPVMLAALWTGQASIAYNFLSPFLRDIVWIIAVLFLTATVIALIPSIRRLSGARFWAAGMCMSLIPACGSAMVDDRLLIFVAIGAMALTACFVGSLVEDREWVPKHVVWRRFAWCLWALFIAVHLAVASAGHFVRPYAVSYFEQHMLKPVLPVAETSQPATNELIVVSAPNPVFFQYLHLMRAHEGLSKPLIVRLLSPAFTQCEVSRPDSHTLVLRSPSESLLSMDMATSGVSAHDVWGYMRAALIYRPHGYPTKVGERRVFNDFTIEVMEVGHDGFPKAVSFSFTKPLTDPSMALINWDWRSYGYKKFDPPQVGESVITPGPFFQRRSN
jgi:hypothetical protein